MVVDKEWNQAKRVNYVHQSLLASSGYHGALVCSHKTDTTQVKIVHIVDIFQEVVQMGKRHQIKGIPPPAYSTSCRKTKIDNQFRQLIYTGIPYIALGKQNKLLGLF